MGGAHGKASGSINFKTLQATADNAVKAGTYEDETTKLMNAGDANVTYSYYKNNNLQNYIEYGENSDGWKWDTERSTVSSGVQV